MSFNSRSKQKRLTLRLKNRNPPPDSVRGGFQCYNYDREKIASFSYFLVRLCC